MQPRRVEQELIQGVQVTAGCASDLCSNLGFFQGNMEQRLLGISVSERDVGLGLEKVAFDLCSGVMGSQVFGV